MKKILITFMALMLILTTQASAEYNKYNDEDYVNITFSTLNDVAASCGMSTEEFKAEFGLPSDMPGDTTEAAAYYNLTIENYAKFLGQSTEETVYMFRQLVRDGYVFDKNTKWGEVEANIPATVYFEDSIDSIKALFDIERDISEDTTIGELRCEMYRSILEQSGILTYFKKNDLLVMLKGQYVDFVDVPPIIINNSTMVPFRKIFEVFGAEVAWDPATRTVTGSTPSGVITLTIDDYTMYVNGQPVTLYTPPVIVDGRTLVPIRAIAEALHTDVTFNANTRTVVIH